VLNRFPYALRRDLVSDGADIETPVSERFPYALRRDLVSDQDQEEDQAAEEGQEVRFPYALRRDLVSDEIILAVLGFVVAVSIRLTA
jgi:hypothetical protein